MRPCDPELQQGVEFQKSKTSNGALTTLLSLTSGADLAVLSFLFLTENVRKVCYSFASSRIVYHPFSVINFISFCLSKTSKPHLAL